MSDAGVKDPLQQRLSACSELLDELKEVLQQEATTLWHRDFEALVETTQKKASLLARIEEAKHDVTLLLDHRGLDPSPDELDSLTETPELHSMRQTFLDALQTCHHLNQLNGSSIDASRTFTTQLLAILQGSARENMRYGTNGRIKAEEPTQSRPLATA